MKIIVFKFFEDIYLRDYIFDERAFLLSNFFTSDVGSYGESFIESMKDPDAGGTSSNYCFLEKEGDEVFIGCQFDEDPYENGITMPQKELVSILNQWGELIKQDPQEIIMYKEGELYRLEGHGFPDKQK